MSVTASASDFENARPNIGKPLGSQRGQEVVMRGWFKLALLGAALVVGLSPSNASEKWPSQNITMLVPYAAGGGTDVIARVLA
jgi:hypothetical protein